MISKRSVPAAALRSPVGGATCITCQGTRPITPYPPIHDTLPTRRLAEDLILELNVRRSIKTKSESESDSDQTSAQLGSADKWRQSSRTHVAVFQSFARSYAIASLFVPDLHYFSRPQQLPPPLARFFFPPSLTFLCLTQFPSPTKVISHLSPLRIPSISMLITILSF